MLRPSRPAPTQAPCDTRHQGPEGLQHWAVSRGSTGCSQGARAWANSSHADSGRSEPSLWRSKSFSTISDGFSSVDPSIHRTFRVAWSCRPGSKNMSPRSGTERGAATRCSHKSERSSDWMQTHPPVSYTFPAHQTHERACMYGIEPPGKSGLASAWFVNVGLGFRVNVG